MSDLIIKLTLSDKERVLFSGLDMLVTPANETEIHDLALSIDQARGMFHYLLRFEQSPPAEEWGGIREMLLRLRTAMETTQTVLGRSALVGKGHSQKEPLQ